MLEFDVDGDPGASQLQEVQHPFLRRRRGSLYFLRFDQAENYRPKLNQSLPEDKATSNRNYVVLAGGGGEGNSGIPNAVVVSEFDFASYSLSDQPVNHNPFFLHFCLIFNLNQLDFKFQIGFAICRFFGIELIRICLIEWRFTLVGRVWFVHFQRVAGI